MVFWWYTHRLCLRPYWKLLQLVYKVLYQVLDSTNRAFQGPVSLLSSYLSLYIYLYTYFHSVALGHYFYIATAESHHLKAGRDQREHITLSIYNQDKCYTDVRYYCSYYYPLQNTPKVVTKRLLKTLGKREPNPKQSSLFYFWPKCKMVLNVLNSKLFLTSRKIKELSNGSICH